MGKTLSLQWLVEASTTFTRKLKNIYFPYLCVIHWHPIGIYARLFFETALKRISNILFGCSFVLVFVYDGEAEKNHHRQEGSEGEACGERREMEKILK